jgi:hypothetical protein
MTTTDVLSGLTPAQILADAGISQANKQQISMTASNGSSTLATGVISYVYCQFSGTITSSLLTADASGSLVVDVWKINVGSFPPTVTNSITASALPTLSSAQISQDSTLTGWTTTVTAGDVFAFNINSASGIKTATLTLLITTS